MKTLVTVNFNIIQELCKDSMNNSKMVVLIGYTGAGKTVGLQYFVNTNKNKSIYLVVRKSMRTKDFYKELLTEVGYQGDATYLDLYTIINLIVLKINDFRKQKMLLIIDEAGKFTSRQLEYIHEIRDQTIGNLGIVLSGPEYFFDNLYSWKEKRVVGIPEVFRRIQNFVELDPPTFREIRAFCYAFGIMDMKVIKKKFKECENFGEIKNKIDDYLVDKS